MRQAALGARHNTRVLNGMTRALHELARYSLGVSIGIIVAYAILALADRVDWRDPCLTNGSCTK
jgi:hypothetical protein